MNNIENKLDEILSTMKSLDQRLKKLENLEKKFENLETKMQEYDTKFEEIESEQDHQDEKISKLEDDIKELKEENNQLRKEAETQRLSKELYSKRLNYLIHGIPENDSNPWETRKQTETVSKKFIEEGLNITDTSSISLADIHRLPQHPIYDKRHRKITRPIIIKFSTIFDKQKFTQNLKHLKQYNLKNREACSATEYVYATEHLPKELQEQKKRLLPFYKDARNNKKKTVWKIQNCEYCLFVDDVRVYPEH